MEIQITIADTLDVTSRKETVTLDVVTLSLDTLAQALVHGLTQKVADDAAKALKVAYDNATYAQAEADFGTGPEADARAEALIKAATADQRKAWGEANAERVSEATRDLMQAACDNLAKHGWTVRTAGVGSGDPLDVYRIRAARAAITNNKSGDNWLAYEAIDSSDQKARAAFLLDLATAQAELIDPIAIDLKRIDDEKAQAVSFKL